MDQDQSCCWRRHHRWTLLTSDFQTEQQAFSFFALTDSCKKHGHHWTQGWWGTHQARVSNRSLLTAESYCKLTLMYLVTDIVKRNGSTMTPTKTVPTLFSATTTTLKAKSLAVVVTTRRGYNEWLLHISQCRDIDLAVIEKYSWCQQGPTGQKAYCRWSQGTYQAHAWYC